MPFTFELMGKTGNATAPPAGGGAPTASGPPLGVGKSGGGVVWKYWSIV